MLKIIYNTLKSVVQPRKAFHDYCLRREGIQPHDFYAYNLPWLIKRKFNIILDIGAARGTHTLLFHRLFPAARIIAFEPLPASFSELMRRTQAHHNIKCQQCALSDEEGLKDFHIGGPRYADASSLLPVGKAQLELWPGSGSDQCLKVQTHCLDSLLEVNRSDRIFVKMDVQGGELMVIKGGIKVFAAADVVVVEASMRSLYAGSPTFHELYEKLISLGFEYAGILEQSLSPDRSGEVIQNNVIFCHRQLS